MSNTNTAETIEVQAEQAEAPVQAETAEAPAKKTRKKRVNKNPKPYPFRSKASIVEQVKSDDGFCCQCLGILYERQTASERDKGTTETRNRQGFMSSHAVVGTKLAKKLAEEGTLEGEDLETARAITVRYGRQLAAHFRAEECEADPAKAELAALFSAN